VAHADREDCALDALRRERTALTFAPEAGRLLQSEWTLVPVAEEFFGPNAIKDDLLRMMFSCCHPRLPEEAQVALILHILCGFSVDEIASSFVSGHAAVEKRITRAKRVLATSKEAVRHRGSGGLLRQASGRSGRTLLAV
jgi:RNA polymerase sigma-70 factor (ECF subfamily)